MRSLTRAWVLCFGLALASQAAGAQGTGGVTGLVSDSTGRPLADVLVFVDQGAAAVLTDPAGLFALNGLTLERHVLGYRRAGYAPRTFALDLSTGDAFREVAPVVLRPGPEPTASLTGRVTEGDGGPGLAGATVELNGRVVATTDSTGAFAATGSAVAWGPNDLVVRHNAFADRSVNDRIWISNPSETFDLEVALDVQPIVLAAVDVSVESRVLAAEGFYERREELGGAGTFLTRVEIADMNPRRLEDVIRRALNGAGISRSIRQREASRFEPAQSFGNASDGEPCIPVFYVNGLRMGDVWAPVGVSSGLDQLVHLEDVEGIEIYETISGLPAKYSPIGSTCGVILIWTS
jgi:hypothetical protein